MNFFSMNSSVTTYGSGGIVVLRSTAWLSKALIRVVSRGPLRLGRVVPFVTTPFVIGVVCACADPGRRLLALKGDEDGRPFLAAFVCIDTLGFFVFVAVPVDVGFDILTIFLALPRGLRVKCARALDVQRLDHTQVVDVGICLESSTRIMERGLPRPQHVGLEQFGKTICEIWFYQSN